MNGFRPAREKIVLRTVNEDLVTNLSGELRIHPAIISILVGRDIRTAEACRRFFNPAAADFLDPFTFTSMERAVGRILAAIDKKEKIAVYGDYDVDGITSTALLVRVLRRLGADCDYYLPNRLTEGYGLSETGIRSIASSGAKLMITVDCGITAAYEVDLAGSLGMDSIVTDHHEPKGVEPGAIAVLNPKYEKCGYPDQTLAGVGVALKLCQALALRTNRGEELWMTYLDLVALGTAADIVPLTGENRIITRLGFDMLCRSGNPGIRALISVQGLEGKPLSTSSVVFQLAPCINAVGRLGDPRRGVELLLTDDYDTAVVYARELKAANIERRALDADVAEEAELWVEKNCRPERDFAIVTGQPHWHVGVIGIVASKMVERFHRPALLFSIGDDGLARGSGRSIPKLHLLDALSECASELETFGGHAAAAGMCIKSENIPKFREAFNEVVRKKVKAEDLVPQVTADVELTLDCLNPSFYRVLREMEPFGPGNMRPVLLCRGLKHRYPPRLVGNNHLKMTLTQSGVTMDAIGFNFGDRIGEINSTPSLSLAFSLDENEWNGKVSLQMKVKGITV